MDLKKKIGKEDFCYNSLQKNRKGIIRFWHSVKPQVEGDMDIGAQTRKSTARNESEFVLLAETDSDVFSRGDTTLIVNYCQKVDVV